MGRQQDREISIEGSKKSAHVELAFQLWFMELNEGRTDFCEFRRLKYTECLTATGCESIISAKQKQHHL